MALMNPVSANGSLASYQPVAEKDKSSGYVGLGASGEAAIPGKVGFNGATPVGKAASVGSATTGVSVSLLDVLTVKAPINDHAAKIDAITECLKKVGLMS